VSQNVCHCRLGTVLVWCHWNRGLLYYGVCGSWGSLLDIVIRLWAGCLKIWGVIHGKGICCFSKELCLVLGAAQSRVEWELVTVFALGKVASWGSWPLTPVCLKFQLYVVCKVQLDLLCLVGVYCHNTLNIDKDTLHWRHVSAHTVAIFRPYTNIQTNTDHCTGCRRHLLCTSVIKISIRVVVKILVITKLGITMKLNIDHCTWVYVTQCLCLTFYYYTFLCVFMCLFLCLC
jgi:hypothetical protein